MWIPFYTSCALEFCTVMTKGKEAQRSASCLCLWQPEVSTLVLFEQNPGLSIYERQADSILGYLARDVKVEIVLTRN